MLTPAPVTPVDDYSPNLLVWGSPSLYSSVCCVPLVLLVARGSHPPSTLNPLGPENPLFAQVPPPRRACPLFARHVDGEQPFEG